MITSPNLRIYAAEGDDSNDNSGGGGGSNDNSNDKQESNDDGGDKQESSSNDSPSPPQEDKQETNDVPKDEPKQQKEQTNTNEELGNPNQETLANDQPQTTEPPQTPIKDRIKDDPNEVCDVSHDCFGPGVTPTHQWNCEGYYCAGDTVKSNPKIGDTISKGPKHINHPDFGKDNKWKDCKDSKRCNDEQGKNHWCDWHKCGDDHNHDNGNHDHHNHNHKHNHNSDRHYYNHDTNIYYYYYTNDYSNNHATVILQPDYSHTNNYHDIRIVIGDSNEFDTVVNFAGKPENFVITGLDINEGEQFDVCMKNESNDKVNCVTATLKDEDKAVYVDIRVP
jgi:hypothetical protein